MGLYHFHVEVLSRSTGRSATGAAAYQAAERLEAVAYVAYQSGEKLHGVGDKIIHDYTRKKGVVHKEIILPKDAPSEFKDRETLWNVVEKRERRDDSRLLREIDAALQTEFTLQENIELLREFVRENFVDKGMIADLAIHDKGDGNPHAHVMLTMRDVSREGFGAKNFDWNKKSVLLEWRKNWAEINNSALKWLGFDVRIDHRSYKEQGLDREPMIHLGHKAWALEKKGVKTDRGNHNRAVQKRNAEREGVEIVPESGDDEGGEAPPERQKDPREGREAEKTRQVMEQLRQQRENAAAVQVAEDIADDFRVKKSVQVLGKMQDRQRIIEYLYELVENRLTLEKGLYMLSCEGDGDERVLRPLAARTKEMRHHVEKITALQGEAAGLQGFRQNLRLWDWEQKRDVDEKIRQANLKIENELEFFKNRFHVDFALAHVELRRNQAEIERIERRKRMRAAQAWDIMEKQAAVELEYQTILLLIEFRSDRQQIFDLLDKMKKPPESAHERQLWAQVDRRLNTVTDENFRKIIKTLPPEQAQILIKMRQPAKSENKIDPRTKGDTGTPSRTGTTVKCICVYNF